MMTPRIFKKTWLGGVLVFVTAAVACLPAGAQQACDVTKTLAQMDAASAKFQSAQADFVWDQYVAAVQDDEKQSGVIYFSRHGSGAGAVTSMAADIKLPAAKYVTFDGSDVSLYTPGLNQLQIFSAGNNKDMAETFLNLGFGGSGKDLAKAWDVTCIGNETIDGVNTAKLNLVAKQASVRNTFSSVVIWIDPTRAISVKQVFTSSLSGDKKTDLFTNIQYNKGVNASVFKIKTKPGVQVTRK